MFFNPAALLTYMLEAEARQETFYNLFPPWRVLAPLYDTISAPLKFSLIALMREQKPSSTRDS